MQQMCDQVLCNARPCDHAAHLYVDDLDLVEAVATYVRGGVDRGEGALVVATKHHLLGIHDRLEGAGISCDSLRSSGQLACFDAEKILPTLLRNGAPDHAVFNEFLRPVIEKAQRSFAGLAAYGELVDLLWQQGKSEQAHILEEWWNELIAEYGFSLLCAYKVDIFDFDDTVHLDIETICSTHTHLLPVAEFDRFERSVDEALRQVFHNGDGAAVRRHLVERCRRTTVMPPAQVALLELHDLLPFVARDVRMIAREHYRRNHAITSGS